MKKIILGIFLSCFASLTQAKLIHFGKSVEVIRVGAGGPTIFRFPSEVRTISRAKLFDIKPANSDEPDYSVLSVTPRFKEGSGQVTFILSDDSVVRTKIIISDQKSSENLYDFQESSVLLTKGMEGKSGPSVSAMDLMRAMIRDDFVSGYKYRKIGDMSTKLGQAVVRLVRVYEGDRFNGYVFKIKNVDKKKKYRIDVRRLSVGRPNLAVLSQVDLPVLGPKKSKTSETTLRVVTKSTAYLTDIVLPISTHQVQGAK